MKSFRILLAPILALVLIAGVLEARAADVYYELPDGDITLYKLENGRRSGRDDIVLYKLENGRRARTKEITLYKLSPGSDVYVAEECVPKRTYLKPVTAYKKVTVMKPVTCQKKVTMYKKVTCSRQETVMKTGDGSTPGNSHETGGVLQ